MIDDKRVFARFL